MKKLTLALSFMFALALSAGAQTNPALEKTTTRVTRVMVETMSLNENEYIKLKNLNQDRLVQATEAEKLYADDEAMLEARLQEIDEDFENKLFTMLNSRQLEAYADFKQKPEGNFMALVQEVRDSSSKKSKKK